MDSLPLEILDIIALAGGYRGLLCFRVFTMSLTPGRRVDFMIDLGYTVEILRNYIVWKYNGIKHRLDGPAIEFSSGTKHWYMNGERHRIGGPASEYFDGSKRWIANGQLYRIDSPTMEHCDVTNEPPYQIYGGTALESPVLDNLFWGTANPK